IGWRVHRHPIFPFRRAAFGSAQHARGQLEGSIRLNLTGRREIRIAKWEERDRSLSQWLTLLIQHSSLHGMERVTGEVSAVAALTAGDQHEAKREDKDANRWFENATHETPCRVGIAEGTHVTSRSSR